MDNKTKIIIALTLIMTVLINQVGQDKVNSNFSGVVEAQATTEESTIEPVDQSTVNLNTEPSVSDSAVRIRIIPNSNSYEDQQAKMMVTYAIEEYLTENEASLTSLETTREFIAKNITTVESTVDKVLTALTYRESYEVTYGAHLFPEKELDGQFYEAGYYESLVIKLGEGQGSNWWCFMNTQLCLGPAVVTEDATHWNTQYETTKTTQEDIANHDVQFFLVDLFQSIFKSSEQTPTQTTVEDESVKKDVAVWYLYEDEY